MGNLCHRPASEDSSRTGSFSSNVEYLRIIKNPEWMMEFDDLSMDFEPSLISSDCSASTLDTNTSSLRQIVKFKIGGRLLCMSWNMQHDFKSTPFDFYWNPWGVNWLRDDERILIAKTWDVAQVLLKPEEPSELSRTIKIKAIIPSFLLAPQTVEKFYNSNESSVGEATKLSRTSIHDFLLSVSDRNGVFREVFNTHSKHRQRITSPLQPVYHPAGFQQLLEEDISLLPILLLDSLHVFIIRFTSFLIREELEEEFFYCSSDKQIELLSSYNAGATSENNLRLPREFVAMKMRLFKNWNSRFEAKNIVQQIQAKAIAVDIIFLQRVKEDVYNELAKQLSGVYSIIPNKFPAGEKDVTVTCLLNSTVHLQGRKKQTQMDQHNFAVLCKSYDIQYYVGAVCLTNNYSSCVKRKRLTKLLRSIGTTRPLILGGDFGFDLSANDNADARTTLKNYNGINYDQKSPFKSLISRTSTHLNFQARMGGKPFVGVPDGIFSSFPLVDDAFTDLNCWGENISDRAPIFQEIQLGLY